MKLIEKLNHSDMKMTSLDISGLVNSEHPHVRTSIERLAKRGSEGLAA